MSPPFHPKRIFKSKSNKPLNKNNNNGFGTTDIGYTCYYVFNGFIFICLLMFLLREKINDQKK